MNLEKEYNRIGQGITSSPSKKNVLKTRLEYFMNKLKKQWYGKLILKLNDIKSGELDLSDYIEEVNLKIKK